jgi:S1-C subfamily serine protease
MLQPILAQMRNNTTFTLPEIYRKIENSIVQITVPGQASSNSSILSGFVYDKSGHVITVHRVIAGGEGGGRIYATFPDGTNYIANIVASDRDTGIAVLHLEGVPKNKLIPLSIGNSTDLSIGQQVAAIGSPFAFSGSLTTGIISQVDRVIPNPDTGLSIPDILQTNIPIDPGAGGGPLLNMDGQVVGMNILSFQNIGFAISSILIANDRCP